MIRDRWIDRAAQRRDTKVAMPPLRKPGVRTIRAGTGFRSNSALVASDLDAELLVLVTDVEGLYDRDPHGGGDAHLVGMLDPDDESAGEIAGESDSGVGRGGMRSKVEAARIAARAGCRAVHPSRCCSRGGWLFTVGSSRLRTVVHGLAFRSALCTRAAE